MKKEYQTSYSSFKRKEGFGLQKEDKKGYKQVGEQQWILLSKLNFWHEAE